MRKERSIPRLQNEVKDWLEAAFGPSSGPDIRHIQITPEMRDLRGFEEFVELVQAGTMSREKAHEIVDRVYDREKGQVALEVGGAMMGLLGICIVNGIDAEAEANKELARIYGRIPAIRARQSSKAQPDRKPLMTRVSESDRKG